jgi:dTDP-4-dehydrorhamnose 3,5-epimerase
MKCTPTAIPDVVLIEPQVFGDARGFFLETWNSERFRRAGIVADFVQDNHSHSQRWTLRGLHYQLRHPQGKLVQVVTGTVFDVIVDLRRSSATFGQHVGIELAAESHQMLWVPPGCAHGFMVLSDCADFLYKCTDYYYPEHERAISWRDPQLCISWPLPEGATPVLSVRDAQAGPLRDADCYP